MIRGQAAQEQSAEAVRRRAAVRMVVLAPLLVGAGGAGLVADSVVVDEEKPAVVEGGLGAKVLTALAENQGPAHGWVIGRHARRPQRLQRGDRGRQVGLRQRWG